ncbi:hypothetical protein D0809_06815 [Flavobacterium circumlabens]|uniref:Uncharacterized protein n=1 Tax=Flavobacterium circumlabens TaxID=2133765 RepID=A0A4Y7UGB8_9FLAO|nr:hypothetical protein D0809_06815 [Flavobacterium circumlabens]
MCFYYYGIAWHPKAVFGIAAHCITLLKSVLLCKIIFIKRLMQKQDDISGKKVNGQKPFFPANINPPVRADFPFTRKEQVVF